MRFTSFYYSHIEGVGCGALSSECKIEQTDFTSLMSFLSPDLIEEISANPDTCSGNT